MSLGIKAKGEGGMQSKMLRKLRRKKVLKKQKGKGFIIGGCDTIITEKHGAESELSDAMR